MSSGIQQNGENGIVAEIKSIENYLRVKPLHKAYVSVDFLCVPSQFALIVILWEDFYHLQNNSL